MVEEFETDLNEISEIFNSIKRTNDYNDAPKLYDLCSKVYEKYEPVNDHRVLSCFKKLLKLVMEILFFMSYANTYHKEDEKKKENTVMVKKLEKPNTN